MQTTQQPAYPELRKAGRRFGYGVAIVVQLLLLWVVQNLTEWELLPFLTTEFDEVVPLISFFLLFAIVANAAYLVFDDFTLHAIGEIGVNVFSAYVSWQILQAFPFDFSMYEFDWAIVARVILILAIVGAGIGAIVEAGRLIRGDSNRLKGVSHANDL